MPLHTLRADIDYGFSEAKTTYGVIGVKVWVYKGDTLGQPQAAGTEAAPAPSDREDRRPRRPAGDRPGPRPGAPRRGARKPEGGEGAPAGGEQKEGASVVKRVRKTAAGPAATPESGETK